MRLAGEVHERPTVNIAGCVNSGCHGEMKQVSQKHFYDRKAPSDYDGNGKIESVQEEVEGLLDKIINSKGSGLLQTMKDPPYDAKGRFINSKTQYPIEVVAALYNYKFVKEDGF